MAATRWAVGVGLLLAASASGCVSCGYEACPAMLAAGPNAEAPLCDRQHVYAFLISGLTPDVGDGLEDLRLKLAQHGYDKVYRGELCHAGWMAFEMKSILRCDPQARFVVVGYDFGCGAAAALARHARRHNWPIDAVIHIDPLTTPDSGAGPQTVVIRAGGDCTACGDQVRYVNIVNGSHWTLPTHERTVAAIAEVLKASAMKVEHPEVWVEPAEMEVPNRSAPVPMPGTSTDWQFLEERLDRQFEPLAAPFDSCQPGNRYVLPNVYPVPRPSSPLPVPRKVEPTP